MTFWSSQKLESKLRTLVGHNDKDMVDCNAVTMRVGGEIYVTPGLEQTAPFSQTKRQLTTSEPIAIPSGQFAFLLTEEVVSIPADVMGFISIKATYKSKGLVNVSGFHVDPGWSGPLIFAVFNAGPATIHLERGMSLFLLWIADLDKTSAKRKVNPGPKGIPPVMINNITGVVDSVYALEKRLKVEIKEVGDKYDLVRDKLAEIAQRQTRILIGLSIAAVLGGAVVGVFTKIAADGLFPATIASPGSGVAASPPSVQPNGR